MSLLLPRGQGVTIFAEAVRRCGPTIIKHGDARSSISEKGERIGGPEQNKGPLVKSSRWCRWMCMEICGEGVWHLLGTTLCFPEFSLVIYIGDAKARQDRKRPIF